MNNVTILYLLNQAGQQTSLKESSGESAGREVQGVECPADLYDLAFQLADVAPDGKCWVKIGGDAIANEIPVPVWPVNFCRGAGAVEGPWEVTEHQHQIGDETFTKYEAVPTMVDCVTFDAPITWDPHNQVVRIQEVLQTELQRREAIEKSRVTAEAEAERRNAEQAPKIQRARARVEQQEKAAAEQKEKEQEEKRRQEKAAKAQMRQEAEQWIRQHGSARLQMILEEGFLADSWVVYREERLEKERPGWYYIHPLSAPFTLLGSPRAPSEAALLALCAAREKQPDVQLRYHQLAHRLFLVDTFLGRTILCNVEEDLETADEQSE